MRIFVRALAVLLVVGVVLGIGSVVYNAGVGGVLDVFPRVDSDSLFR